MTPRDFCLWLQGFFDLGNPEAPPMHQWQFEKIKRRLDELIKDLDSQHKSGDEK